MIGYLNVIFSDFRGLCKCCGVPVGIKWFMNVALNIMECIKNRNLQPADRATGNGPFLVSFGKAKAILSGDNVISGIREIWVRDTYTGGGYLSIAPDATVVDLGANMGNFTLLALAHGPKVRVFCVEPSNHINSERQRQIQANNWVDRVKNCHHFIGGKTEIQAKLKEDEDFAGVSFISEDKFVKIYNLKSIDFLKCDIEGSEFELFKESGQLLKMTQQFAIELHDHIGNRGDFIIMLENMGFKTLLWKDAPGCCVVLAKRAPEQCH